MIKSNLYNPELTLKKGIHTTTKPSKQNLDIIKKGIEILNKENSLNHVQGLVIDKFYNINKEKSEEQKMINSLNKDRFSRKDFN